MAIKPIKASLYVARAKARVGEGYVYGATGQKCSLTLLRSKQGQYGGRMGNGYYQLNGDYAMGKCAKWLGKAVAPKKSPFAGPVRVQDCSNFLQDVRRELGQAVASASADMLWKQCKVRGKLATMPRTPGVLVFSVNNQGVMHHVGLYIGGGKVVESANVVSGVVISGLPGGWEHWGYANFLDYDLPSEVPAPTSPEPPQPHPETEDVVCTVERGDTLSAIGRRYGVKWQTIASANGIKAPYVIFSRQKLRIPGVAAEKEPATQPVVHTVAKGESLSRIANHYGKRWQDIAGDNGIRAPWVIHPGQRLRIL